MENSPLLSYFQVDAFTAAQAILAAIPVGWEFKRTMDWVQWHVADKRAAWIWEGGKLQAIGLARGIDSIEEADDDYAHKEHAVGIWLSSVALFNHGKTLLNCALLRFPKADWIAFSSPLRDKEVRKIKISDITRFA
jgi:hypothetical protein